MNPILLKKTLNNLYLFYRAFVANGYEDNVHAPHIEKIARKLTEITFKPTAKNRLCVSVPPQHSKSSLITIAYTVWLILQNPNLKILVINAESSLSETFGIQIRDLIGRLNGLNGITISNVKSSSTYIMFEKNGKLAKGHIRLVGASGSITGHPEDVIIIDDPYKGIDDITPTLLEKKWLWYSTIVEQRFRPRTIGIILHTRWHSNDLIGHLQEEEPEKYDFMSFPAIDDNDNILWPQYYDRAFYLHKQKRLGDRMFQALYQQKPLDLTSDFFHTDKLHWDETYKNLYSIASCRSYDMAYTSQKKALENKINADYTAGVHAEKINDNHYIFSDFLYKRLGKKNIKHIQSTARFDGLGKPILIETGTKGGAARELFDLWDVDYLTEYECHQSEPIGTKADRATALANAMYDGKIHIYCMDTELRKEIKEQLSSFPNGTKDDLVDAMAYAYNFLKDKTDGKSIYRTGNATYY